MRFVFVGAMVAILLVLLYKGNPGNSAAMLLVGYGLGKGPKSYGIGG